MKIKYLGHSCFEILTKDRKILVDPFLIMSPDYNVEGVTDIFVTHGHSDHLGSAIEISKKTGAMITANFELANYCASKGANVNPIGIGGWMQYDWGRVIAVNAVHSSSTPEGNYAGLACGYIFAFGGVALYHAGDTCLTQDMKIIAELYRPDVVLLPIGGRYTMDVEQAVTAASWLGATTVIPMHYNTFDGINADVDTFARQIRNMNKIPIVMTVGQETDF